MVLINGEVDFFKMLIDMGESDDPMTRARGRLLREVMPLTIKWANEEHNRGTHLVDAVGAHFFAFRDTTAAILASTCKVPTARVLLSTAQDLIFDGLEDRIIKMIQEREQEGK